MCKCGTEGRGLLVNLELLTAGADDLKSLFSPEKFYHSIC